ncbi:HSP20-like chaperone [Quillaja saponaria]|uniref:Co-chaperone protein p23 n=1 Tax=Quillaja saponaria TaxID=32244 RepID=A0AAD7VER7_QUISA|nr:HSP20-like chaperone [Quillaja saponaria]
MSLHPEVKWAQRVDKVFITVLLADAKNAKVDLHPDGVFTFSASAGAGDNLYELKLELFDKVNVEESKINIGVRSIFCILEKAESGWWKKLLRGDGKTPHYMKVDWDKWVDEDDDTGGGDLDMGGMDFSNLGGMGGMDGMGDDFDEDSDEEVSKLEEQDTRKVTGGAEEENDADKKESTVGGDNKVAAPST